MFSLAVSLTFITVSIALSPWFNIVKNALSDLDHAVRSSIASLFNFGSSLGGVLAVVAAVILVARVSKALAISMSVSRVFPSTSSSFQRSLCASLLDLGSSLLIPGSIPNCVRRNFKKRFEEGISVSDASSSCSFFSSTHILQATSRCSNTRAYIGIRYMQKPHPTYMKYHY